MREVRAKNGDALAVLFDRYENLVFTIAVNILGDRTEAEDPLQTVFMELYQHPENVNPGIDKLDEWLSQRAYHRSNIRMGCLNTQQSHGETPADDRCASNAPQTSLKITDPFIA